ncbi:hypothetical protein AB835_04410 [Candidatus Endobugula sertula]|uniref:Flagellar basal-body/hook protein C-terminal domain-containing protein n=1 Tax=Candidatus Endobugula sertula TaxID=62101 RepID=A0A1D2QRQ6_9GAMM|nr:hypothetical protein AB835_04410 [Candidatus Endobugula sertula]
MINSSSGVSSVFQQGISGLYNSSKEMVEVANDLVRSGSVETATNVANIVEPLVKIRQQQHVFDASAQVVKVADEALGALIDTQA